MGSVEESASSSDDHALWRTLLPAVEQAIDAVVLIDASNIITFFNAAAERLWGYSQAEVLGRNVKCLVPQSIREEHDGYIETNRTTGHNRIVGTSRDVLMERKDGSQIWGMLSLSKVKVGGSSHYMALCRDISEEVRQREEIELLSLAVNETDRAVIILDADRRIVHVNRAFTDLLGYSQEEAEGRLPSEFLTSPRTDPDALAHARQSVWQATALRIEILAATKDGKDIWVSASINPVLKEDGSVRNIVAVLVDITEQREIEALQRTILEAIASGLRLADVMDVLCRRVEAISSDVICSVLSVDDENCLRPVAGPNLPQSYHDAINGVPIGEGVGSCGTTAFRRAPVIVTDIATDPLWEHYKHLVLPLGLNACWSSPIMLRDKRVAGTFAFYFREPRGPTALERHIVDACLYLCIVAMEGEDSREKIARLAHFDALTGLPNRFHTYERIDSYIREAERESLAVLLLDLDNFKDLNDALGHPVGDQLLLEVANRLELLCGARGSVGRTDGDTFAVVVRRCSVEAASALADDIMEELKKPFAVAGFSVGIGASIGIALYPSNGADGQTLTKNADLAMHRSKISGRARATFFSGEMNEIVEERLRLGAKLRDALARGDLQLHYQPQIEGASGKVYGVEALARWTDEELGPISPGKFIPLAEDIGEIGEIGRWSLREACRQLAQWRREGIEMPSISVNVSAKHFRTAELPHLIAGLLREYDLAPASLTIEITETAMMDAGKETFDTITKVRDLGVGLSMDDFGTGFSSLARLAQLPVTELKIDRDFMQGFEKNDAKKAITTAAIRVGQSLGLTVVAEGVETDDQRTLLTELGCDIVQGYLVSRPLPPDELTAWLSRV